MSFFQAFTIVSLLLVSLLSTSIHAAIFDIRNNCPYTVWAAALPGGGRRLDPHQTWSLHLTPGTRGARIWPRTGCQFDGAGRGRCATGDCGGLLQCQGSGVPPATLAEFSLTDKNYFDISVIDGFNVPMEFSPTSGSRSGKCRGIRCAADINGQCPGPLRTNGGCNGPCTVFKTNNYCCTNQQAPCGPTDFSRFFKQRCPDAYSYPKDDQTSMFDCPVATNFKVVFCP